MKTIETQRISQINPPDVCNSLRYYAALGDIAEIDRITDRLAAVGLARKRCDTSLLSVLRAQCDRVRAA